MATLKLISLFFLIWFSLENFAKMYYQEAVSMVNFIIQSFFLVVTIYLFFPHLFK